MAYSRDGTGKSTIFHEEQSDSQSPVLKDATFAETLDFLFHKHEAYRYEEEVRLVLSDPDPKAWESEIRTNEKTGIHLPLPALNKVVVSPGAAEWFYSVVEDVNAKYGVQCPIYWAALDALLDDS